MTGTFKQCVVLDFEYETEGGDYDLRPGDLPAPLCMVAYVLDEHLRHIRTIWLWRGDFGPTPPFDIDDDTLIVAYSAWAEMTCFLVLGWRFPVHIFDLHTAYLASSNVLLPHSPDKPRTKPRKRLSDACRAYGIDGWERIDKGKIAEDIGEGRWREYGCEAVFDYCEEDVRNSVLLLRRMLQRMVTSVEHILHWSNYSAKAIARIQAKGIPIDVVLWNLVQENQAAVIGELLRRFDPSYGSEDPIYTADGSFSYERFERWLAATGVLAWPRLESGALDISGDAFRLMYHLPGIEGLHALRDSVGFIAKARLPIGRYGRNRPSLFPFGTASGRNAHRRSPYNAHAGVRPFIRFRTETIGAYLDWRTQEVGIAAAKSGDEALKRAYLSGDVYYALAHSTGFTKDPDRVRWKEQNPGTRQRMKSLQLGINYGMGVQSLAKGLDRHPLIASGIIEQHRRTYSRFWEWRENEYWSAMLNRYVDSGLGWRLHVTTSPNKRTLYNFPMQAGGAEMLRLAAWRLCEADLVPCMLIHDGILFELTHREQVEQAKEIMLQAGRDICDGFEIGVDVDQLLVGGVRYSDKRPTAKKMWATIVDALEAVGALPRRA